MVRPSFCHFFEIVVQQVETHLKEYWKVVGVFDGLEGIVYVVMLRKIKQIVVFLIDEGLGFLHGHLP